LQQGGALGYPASSSATNAARRIGIGRQFVVQARRLGTYLTYAYASEEERAPPTMPRPTARSPRPRSSISCGDDA